MAPTLPKCERCEKPAIHAVERASDEKDELACLCCGWVDHNPNAIDVVEAREAEDEWYLAHGEYPSAHWARVLNEERAKVERLKQGRW